MNLLMVLGFFAFWGAQLIIVTTGLGAEVFVLSLSNHHNFTNGLTDSADTYIFQSSTWYAYYIKIKLGNPPKTFTLLLDTGSSITWVEHADCIECINGDAPPWTGYDEAVSSTSEIVYCDKNRKCNMATNAFCKRSGRCEYSLNYISGDCRGFYFSDTLYMDDDETRTDVFEGFIFGGSLIIRGKLEEHTHGIFGLGNATG